MATPHKRSPGKALKSRSSAKQPRRQTTKHHSQHVRTPAERWSQQVMRTSDALDLEPGVFTLEDPRQIALSLKRSAEASTRRKSSPLHSAMSMLTFHINRAGRQLPAQRRRKLEAAKEELRRAFGRL